RYAPDAPVAARAPVRSAHSRRSRHRQSIRSSCRPSRVSLFLTNQDLVLTSLPQRIPPCWQYHETGGSGRGSSPPWQDLCVERKAPPRAPNAIPGLQSVLPNITRPATGLLFLSKKTLTRKQSSVT